MNPKYSICIPNYNSGRFIAATIESAIAQSVPEGSCEIVVSDNASSDNSLNVIGMYGKRVRLVRRDVTIPVIEHWNACVREASGDYVILLHSDDLIDRDFLRICGEALDSHPNIQMVSCLNRLIDASGSVLKRQRRRATAGELPIDVMLVRNQVSPPSLLVRRTFYAADGYYNPEIMYCADYDLAVRGAAQGGLLFIEQCLCSYRRHSANLGRQDAASLFDIRHTAIAARLWTKRLGLNYRQSRKLQGRMAWGALLATICVLESGGRQKARQRLGAIRDEFRIGGLATAAFVSLWLLSCVPGAWRLLWATTTVYRHLTYKQSMRPAVG